MSARFHSLFHMSAAADELRAFGGDHGTVQVFNSGIAKHLAKTCAT